MAPTITRTVPIVFTNAFMPVEAVGPFLVSSCHSSYIRPPSRAKLHLDALTILSLARC
jgi:hypothetical protein